jgi:hypothetical protein
MKGVVKMAGIALLGLIFYRELPGMKRYWNIRQM